MEIHFKPGQRTPEEQVEYWRGRVTGLNDVVNLLGMRVLKTQEERVAMDDRLTLISKLPALSPAMQEGATDSITRFQNSLRIVMNAEEQRIEGEGKSDE